MLKKNMAGRGESLFEGRDEWGEKKARTLKSLRNPSYTCVTDRRYLITWRGGEGEKEGF